ncbi:MAG: SRPBCC family protein [Chitinophagaceae bacterium]|nr:SRPBCC family protein [Chitinophagaceae bacterium]
MIKRSIIILVLMLLFLAMVTLFLPSSVSVVKTTEINATPERIAQEVNQTENWKSWFPGVKEGLLTIDLTSADEAVLKRPEGEDLKLKFDYKTKDSTAFTLTTEKGNAVDYTFLQTPVTNGTRVTLVVNIDLPWYPWHRVRGIFMDRIYGAQYEEALSNLKQVCEQRGE